MRLIHRKSFAVLYWVIAVVVAAIALAYGGRLGMNSAPELSNGAGVGAGVQLAWMVGGALLGAGIAWALFALVWMALWALDRRSDPTSYLDDEAGSIDDLSDETGERFYRDEEDEYLERR